jgi:hypothetical protein
VHRRLWPEVAAFVLAGEPWQTRRLTPEAEMLFDEVKRAGNLESEGPVARLLESRLLVHGMQFHSHEGKHRKLLETWPRWAARAGQPLVDLPPAAEAKQTLDGLWPGAAWPWEAPKRLKRPFPIRHGVS